MSYEGACFCGAVRLRVSGKPAAMGYCHCESCRRWSASPVNAFILWQPGQIEVFGELASFQKTEKSIRKWCARCGGHVLTEHPLWNLVDVYAAVLPTFDFSPQLHVNYAERVMSMKDPLPKHKDLPAEMGGSGELAA